MNFELDLLIHVPQQLAFDFLLQPKQVSQWVAQMEAFEFLDGAEAPAVGVRFRQVLRHGGKKKIYFGQIETLDRPCQLAIQMNGKNYRMLTIYRLGSDGQGTQLKVMTRFLPNNGFAKWFATWFSRWHKKDLTQKLVDLKDQLEKTYATISPPTRRGRKRGGFPHGERHPDQVVKTGSRR